MTRFQVNMIVVGAIVALGANLPVSSMAGCPCQKGGAGGGVSMGMDYSAGPIAEPYSGSIPGAPYPGTVAGMPYSNPMQPNGVTVGSEVPATGVPGVGPGYSGATATTWQPPPGTIGRTYQMKSRPVPVSMHPRSAIVDVRVKNAKDVRVHDMNVYRTEDYLEGFQDHLDPTMWHFTAEPLIPGIPHICRVEAHFDGPDGRDVKQERYVRLIMGRVIEVEF